MKRGNRSSIISEEIFAINHLIRVLAIKVRKFEIAYIKRDALQFNALKKDILMLQRKIHSILK